MHDTTRKAMQLIEEELGRLELVGKGADDRGREVEGSFKREAGQRQYNQDTRFTGAAEQCPDVMEAQQCQPLHRHEGDLGSERGYPPSVRNISEPLLRWLESEQHKRHADQVQ